MRLFPINVERDSKISNLKFTHKKSQAAMIGFMSSLRKLYCQNIKWDLVLNIGI